MLYLLPQQWLSSMNLLCWLLLIKVLLSSSSLCFSSMKFLLDLTIQSGLFHNISFEPKICSSSHEIGVNLADTDGRGFLVASFVLRACGTSSDSTLSITDISGSVHTAFFSCTAGNVSLSESTGDSKLKTMFIDSCVKQESKNSPTYSITMDFADLAERNDMFNSDSCQHYLEKLDLGCTFELLFQACERSRDMSRAAPIPDVHAHYLPFVDVSTLGQPSMTDAVRDLHQAYEMPVNGGLEDNQHSGRENSSSSLPHELGRMDDCKSDAIESDPAGRMRLSACLGILRAISIAVGSPVRASEEVASYRYAASTNCT
ncbi:hypothetical protein BDY19DRAFT_906927 [Irpex rosettiformis]|uniref:Uncharacterized protein n=1 Tax=Irpex rosettiformis TaxID=378272 RepID=A0ACB8U260_9APHY|nr:hypothetical protein BDY19DRAFT_906927 [Irpex rosettiformis]